MKTLAFFILALAAFPALAQTKKKIHYTYWQAPKPKPSDPMRVYPGMNVPENHADYVWKIRAGGARVVSFDVLGRGGIMGSVPEGIEVKLTAFRQTNSQIYYAIPYTNAKGEAVTGWVNGNAIVPASYTPPQPVKNVNTLPAKDSRSLTP